MDQYEVGYKKPPKHSQFKKGQSGNQKGRPQGTTNLKTDLKEELAEQMTVREAGRPIRISKQRALIKSLVARTLNGDMRCAVILLNLLTRVMDPASEAQSSGEPLNAMECETLEVIQTRLLKARERSENAPNS